MATSSPRADHLRDWFTLDFGSGASLAGPIARRHSHRNGALSLLLSAGDVSPVKSIAELRPMDSPAIAGLKGHGMSPPELPVPIARNWIARAFTLVEDIVYIGLGALLTVSALYLLVTGAIDFAQGILAGKSSTVELLDRMLLILLIVELLYTVQVSFREHALVPEPFLLVGLISAIRRVLVVTAEFGELRKRGEGESQLFVIELAVLTVLILALAVSFVLVRKRASPAGSGPSEPKK